MPVETADQVEQFLLLQGKTESELQAICEGLKLETTGRKSALIDRLVSLGQPKFQRSVIRPQAIPLCTRDENGNLMQAAMETMKSWRKLIYEAKGNRKQFDLVNRDGKSYKATMYYAKAGPRTVQHILENRWYMAHTNQRDLINMLKTEPENFILNIVQKPDSSGNSWLMLHCELKAA